MKCVDCGGEILLDDGIVIRTGCGSTGTVFPCGDCGRLHRLECDEVHKIPVGLVNRSNKKAFLIEGEVVNK